MGKIIDGAYHRAKEILQSNFDKLSALADSLLTNEVIFREDVERILGARPFQKPETALPSSSEAPAAPEAPAATEESSPAEEASGDASESSQE